MAEMASTKAIDYESIVVSRPFRFVVGAKKREFMLHSEVVSRLSRTLNALVNGQMREAREDCAIWEDVDEDTFIRFSKFAYTGDYDAAQPRLVVSTSDVEETIAELPFSKASIPSVSSGDRWSRGDTPPSPAEPGNEGWGGRVPSPSSPPAPMSSGTLDLFCIFVQPYMSKDGWGSWSAPPIHNREDEDYTEVLLSHARMAVFADYHGVSALETLALKELTFLLAAFRLWESRVDDVANLISYVYESTARLNDSACGLRKLVCQYSAYKMEVLWKSAEFKQVFRTFVEFSEDLTDQLLKRL
ncbi:hypothetical protein CONLIGDRAFT_655985 [Coniochaeta ligniaria NRRL 30616]|uniref:BTB domain-containing protein n=1 Tax=Coniochaeta ligniaria NRRL 30616 TaxID=1408157 RepID=A0A1J7JGA2_9PEZI|nr:hypothetical protein CONLIGDRAFT_655985 [Coniochaeta ligniaria NRRL 30616]